MCSHFDLSIGSHSLLYHLIEIESNLEANVSSFLNYSVSCSQLNWKNVIYWRMSHSFGGEENYSDIKKNLNFFCNFFNAILSPLKALLKLLSLLSSPLIFPKDRPKIAKKKLNLQRTQRNSATKQEMKVFHSICDSEARRRQKYNKYVKTHTHKNHLIQISACKEQKNGKGSEYLIFFVSFFPNHLPRVKERIFFICLDISLPTPHSHTDFLFSVAQSHSLSPT